jgi:hypothetical protein
MRHWFLVLLIALLPLRSGLADAMAAGLLCPPPASVHVMVDMGTDEHQQHQQHGDGHQMDAPSQHTTASPCHDGSLCSACQICHSAAVVPTELAPLLSEQARAAPSAALGGFASAERALVLKPPIG